jgi:DNA-binding NarL/FixJ family response regulator
MLSTYREEDLVRASFMAGTSGYLLKKNSPTELITAIRALESGIMQISPEIVKQLIQNQYNPKDKLTGIDIDEPVINGNLNDHFEWIHSLTRRERELFILIATGYDNAEISEKMNLSHQTVMNMVSVVYSKLGVKDRFEIIRLANNRKL